MRPLGVADAGVVVDVVPFAGSLDVSCWMLLEGGVPLSAMTV